jgi:hypothetical protein
MMFGLTSTRSVEAMMELTSLQQVPESFESTRDGCGLDTCQVLLVQNLTKAIDGEHALTSAWSGGVPAHPAAG